MEEMPEQFWQEISRDMARMTRGLKRKKVLSGQERDFLQRFLAMHMQRQFPPQLQAQADSFQALIEERLALPRH